STIQPIMFVILFVYVFGGAVGLALPPGVTYVDYLLPGIFVQSVTFRASNTAVGLSEDLRRGVIDRFRSMPMARSAVLLGRTTADLVRNVLIIGLMVVVGYLVGFSFQAGVLPALGCVALVAAFGFALSWIFAFVSLVVRGAETAQTAGFVLLFPLVFASSVFVPISTLPSWLQPIAKASPSTRPTPTRCSSVCVRAVCAAASTAAEPGSTASCPSRRCSRSRSAPPTGRCTRAPSRAGCSEATTEARAGANWKRCSSCPRGRTGASRRARGPRTCAGSHPAHTTPGCSSLGSSSAA